MKLSKLLPWAWACLIGALSLPAQALDLLPVPQNLPPCELNLPTDRVAAVFPCALIASGEGADPAAALELAGAELRHTYKTLDAAAGMIPDARTLMYLQNTPGISLIPDRPVHAFVQPIEPNKGGKPPSSGGGGGSTQVIPDGVKRIGAAPGILSNNGTGIGVAIVDSGIDLNHSDLAVNKNHTFDAFGGNCQDQNGHGTHVAGIVAALNNSADVVGVAPGATPYCVRVLNAQGSGSDSDVMAGLDWVLANHGQVSPNIKVVNMSLGREGTVDDNTKLRDAVAALTGAGIIVVVAAGNDPSLEISQQIPAAYPAVMAVASTTAKDGSNGGCKFYSGAIPADTASYFSSDGAGVAISAPGEDKEDISKSCFIRGTGILSLALGGGTTRMAGTSMAAPHVAGAAAVLFDAGKTPKSWITGNASLKGTAPLNSPSSSYSFDGTREGVLSLCGLISNSCP